MARESVDAKAARYLAEGRLTIELVVEDEIRATCRGGAEAAYSLGLEAGEWFCTCPATRLCAHLVALDLVTLLEMEPEPVA